LNSKGKKPCARLIFNCLKSFKMSEDLIITKLDCIHKMLTEHNMLQKEVLNFNEAAIYLELSHSHLYKLTSGNFINHYKPNGKKIYFKRTELDSWLLRNRQSSKDEIGKQVTDFTIKNGRG